MSTTALKCSFDIWMARNSNSWTLNQDVPYNCVPSQLSLGLSGRKTSGKESLNQEKSSVKPTNIAPSKRSFSTSQFKAQAQTSSTVPSNMLSKKHVHCTLLNKGNTCYVNVIIQTLRLMQTFWADTSAKPSPLSLAFRNIVAKMDSNSCVDPSPFLSSLEKSLRTSGNRDFANFNIHAQQDVMEILDHILNEVSVSHLSKRTISIRCSTEISCDTCYNSLTTDDIALILKLPVLSDTQRSLNSILISEPLAGDNAPFCHFCGTKKDSESKVSIIDVGSFFIVQLLRFDVVDGAWCKNTVPVNCLPYLDVPIRIDEEVICNRKFELFAVICHSGNKDSGHFTVLIRDEVCGSWLKYNDRAVTRSSLNKLNGSLPYVLFYKAC